MPYKLAFNVSYATSEEDVYPSIELNAHSPSTRGWISARFCEFPQKIILELEERAKIRKIQVLSHQYLIASRIDFLISDTNENTEDIAFNKLGYVTLSSNENTDFKARELKSVHVDTQGVFVKLILHKNFSNKLNTYNQVGLIAVNLIGDKISDIRNRPLISNEISFQSDFIAPTEDLAFDIYQDPEVANIIRRLEKQKQIAVSQESFDSAQKIRDIIAQLHRAGERLGRLVMEKQQAVIEENYERAKLKKFQIDQLRSTLYQELDLPALLTAIDNENCLMQQQRTIAQTVPTKDARTVNEQPHIGDIKSEPNHHSERSFYSESIPDPDDRPLPALKHQSQNNNALLVDPDATLADQISDLPVNTVMNNHSHFHKENPSVLTNSCDDDEQTMKFLDGVFDLTPADESSEFVDVPDKPYTDEKPAELNNGKVNETELPEVLNEAQRHQASIAIDVVGIDLVTKAMSKSWLFRDQALTDLQQHLNSLDADSDPRTEIRSTAFLLRRALNDQVVSIFRRATDLIYSTLVEFAERHSISRLDLYYALDNLIPVLVQRLGDSSARIRQVARSQILTMAQWPQLRQNAAFWTEVTRPFTPVALDRFALSRTEIVTELYAARGLDGATSGDHNHPNQIGAFTLDAIAAFTVRALQHRSNEVRDAAESLMVALYRSENRLIVRRAMPPDDLNTHRHPLYRRLFTKFDRIDMKYAPLEKESGDVVGHGDTYDRNDGKKRKQLDSLQADVRQLRSMMNRDGRSVNGGRSIPPAHNAPVNTGRRSRQDKPARGTQRRSEDRLANRALGSNRASRSTTANTSQTGTKKSEERTRLRSNSPNNTTELAKEADLLLTLENICIFCGEQNDAFNEEGLDLHYWKNCPMLYRCVNCKQVVEISGLSEHLLSECEGAKTGQYVRCSRCFEAIHTSQLRSHPCIPNCVPLPRCMLCHTDLIWPTAGVTKNPQILAEKMSAANVEELWKMHLIGSGNTKVPVCSENPRRRLHPVAQRAVYLNSSGGDASNISHTQSRSKSIGRRRESGFPSFEPVVKYKTDTKRSGIPRPMQIPASIRPG